MVWKAAFKNEKKKKKKKKAQTKSDSVQILFQNFPESLLQMWTPTVPHKYRKYFSTNGNVIALAAYLEMNLNEFAIKEP